MYIKSTFCALVGVTSLAVAHVAQAQIATRIQVDTSSLVGNPAGPFALDFQLNDGLTVGDGNNTAILSHFQFGGGSAVGTSTSTGGAWGDLASGITISDTDGLLNDIYQGFTPGTWLSFDLNLSTNVDLGATPDIFSFSILDGNWMNLATQSLGSDNFVEINIDGVSPDVATFSSVDGKITVTASPVPEASTFGLCGAGLLVGLVALTKRRLRHQ